MARNIELLENYTSPVRKTGAKITFSASDNTITLTEKDYLKSARIERVGNSSKFFGYGICQKLNVKALDINKELNFTTSHKGQLSFSINNGAYYAASPMFEITETNRDEVSGEVSITAYDLLNSATSYTVAELELVAPYTIKDVVTAIGAMLGAENTVVNENAAFDLSYEDGANFDGTETLQEVLIAAAEATQTIYYINNDNELVFKQLDINGEATIEISKERYITLESGTNRRLTKIASVTELGDNVLAELEVSGSIQYVRNNPFWEMREDIGELVNEALAEVGGLTINQFTCSWRGFPFLEIADKISLITKEGGAVASYILNDVIEYNGALTEKTEWSYTDNDGESATNPTNLGEALKQTYARVDKANKTIELVASEVSAQSEALATLRVDTDAISATVTSIQENTEKALETANDDISSLKTQVEAKMSAEDVTIEIKKELENGASKVVTKTGFTFDDDGLTVEKTDSEMKTQITEDGMKVFKNDEEVLTANNVGVNAKNLHATTYLIIGTNSRFEDFGENRTGCFWVGGAI